MTGLKTALFKAGLEALYRTQSHRLMRPFTGGMGAILTLHHVRPKSAGEFAPNSLLEIAPAFLEQTIQSVRANGFDIISLDEACDRLTGGVRRAPFVVFTFDDGYRDNAEFAYPILKKHGVPFTIYLPTAFMDRLGEPWWLVIEEVIAQRDKVTAKVGDEVRPFDCSTPQLKARAFHAIYWWVRALPAEAIPSYAQSLATSHGIDYGALCRRLCTDLCMDWDELRSLGADPLVTFGAHTVDHPMLAKLDADSVHEQMSASRARLERELDRRIDHFAYPVGDPTSAGPREFAIARDLAFRSAVTTRPGVIFPEHAQHMMALPRVSLNGHYQSRRYLEVLLSGAPFLLFNGFSRVNAA